MQDENVHSRRNHEFRKDGTPKEQVTDAEADYIGKLLYQHIDFEGSYHAEPLQAPPPNA